MPSEDDLPARPRPSPADLDQAADALSQMADDPQLISGVHNYCDRWCERCPLTARCLVFKMEQTRRKRDDAEPNRSDEQNQDFWDDVAQNFALTLRLLEREAEKRGIDLNDPDMLADAKAEERRREKKAAREGSALFRQTDAYWKTARKLLERLTPSLEAAEAAINTEAQLGIGTPESTAAPILVTRPVFATCSPLKAPGASLNAVRRVRLSQ